jgi:hypothetical protein
MSRDPNRFGLSGNIPQEVKAEVRRRSKFGCIQCRNAIYTYEHIDPTFANAHAHDPDAICLLCAGCHDRVTRGQIAKETIRASYEQIQADGNVRSPWSDFDLSAHQPEVSIGSSTFYSPSVILRINGEDLLAFERQEVAGTPPRLSGSFYDASGTMLMQIEKNEWVLGEAIADCQIVGRRLTISSPQHHIALSLEMLPPNKLAIRELNMFVDGAVIKTFDDVLGIFLWQDGKQGPGIAVSFDCWHPSACVVADVGKIANPITGPPRIVGGEGIFLDGPDIRLGVGSGKSDIRRLCVWP